MVQERTHLPDEATEQPRRPRGSPISSFPSRLFKFPAPSGRSNTSTRKVGARCSYPANTALIGERETTNVRRNRTATGARGAAMSETGILPSVATTRSRCITPDALPILIAVPRIEAVRSKGRDRDEKLALHPKLGRGVVRRPARRRRRLRRHVRVSAYALFGLAPLGLAACFVWSGHRVAMSATTTPSPSFRSRPADRVCLWGPGRTDSFVDGRRTAVLDRGHRTLHSIEDSDVATYPAVEEAVVLPGYLLPDNSREEPVHEGS
jgi:hypothetical protein